MKFLCLITLDEERMAALAPDEMNALNAGHLALNERLRETGHFIEAEALQPSSEMATLRFRNGRISVVDGPFAESKELIAGFYLIDCKDMQEAIGIAAQFPSASMASIEIRRCRELPTD